MPTNSCDNPERASAKNSVCQTSGRPEGVSQDGRNQRSPSVTQGTAEPKAGDGRRRLFSPAMRCASNLSSSSVLITWRYLKIVGRAVRACWRVTKKSGALAVAFVRDPAIVKEWYGDIRVAVGHFLRWVRTGFRLFGTDVRTSSVLLKRVGAGHTLSLRERKLLVRTTSDCLKLIPFSFFIIVPFAEILLPFFLRLFPGMLPSTFFEQKYDDSTLARRLKAKQELANFWQDVVYLRTKEISEDGGHNYADKAAELHDFQEKLMEGSEYPSLREILRFSALFRDELSLEKMSLQQLNAMTRMLGLAQSNTWWKGYLVVQLRHHVARLRTEDRDYMWEGIDGLTRRELIEACRKRLIRFHDVTEEKMRSDLTWWFEISANHKQVPTSLLLWIRSFYLRDIESAGTDRSALKVTEAVVSATEKDEVEAKEALRAFAERQRASSETAKNKLEVLQHEIEEVVGQPGIETSSTGKEDAQASVAQESSAEEMKEQQEWRQMHRRIQHLEASLRLHREVSSRQKAILDHQLEFLTSMRDNKPTQQKDADSILLDQRVRLMEMIGSFKKDIEAIETFHDNGVDVDPKVYKGHSSVSGYYL